MRKKEKLVVVFKKRISLQQERKGRGITNTEEESLS